MQLKNKLSFEKQLSIINSSSLPQIFLVACSDPFEKSTLLKRSFSRLKELIGDILVDEMDAGQTSPEQLLEKTQSLSLFSEKRILWLDGCDSLKKNSLQTLIQIVTKESERKEKDVYFLLGFSSLKGASELIDKGKKQLLMVDLTGEKPWEKEKRLIEEAYFYLNRIGKKINQMAAKELVAATNKDPSYLAQSLEKIVCYVGDRLEITLEDIAANFAKCENKTIWQMGEAFVWNAEVPDFSSFSAQDFLGIIHQIRTHLQLGAHLAQMDNLYEIASLASEYPYVKPQEMQRYFPIAKNKGSLHYLKGLKELLTLEVAIKTCSIQEELLFDQFYLRWQHG